MRLFNSTYNLRHITIIRSDLEYTMKMIRTLDFKARKMYETIIA